MIEILFANLKKKKIAGGGGEIGDPFNYGTPLRIPAINNGGNNSIGASTAISGDGNYAVIAGSNHTVSGKVNVGVIYVYKRTGANWEYSAELTIAGAPAENQLGWDCALSYDGGVLVSRAYGSTGSGDVYVFKRIGNSWSQVRISTGTKTYADQSVAISSDGNTIAVSNTLHNVDQGCVDIYSWSGLAWIKTTTLIPTDPSSNSFFGKGVAISGNGKIVIVGHGGAVKKAVYVFELVGSTWSQKAKLIPSDATGMLKFGFSLSVSMDGSVIVAGDYEVTIDGIANSGKVHIFRFNNTTWIQTHVLTKPLSETGTYYGYNAKISGDGGTISVGQIYHSTGGILGTGAIYTYRYNGVDWEPGAVVYGNIAPGEIRIGFRQGISHDGNTLAYSGINELNGTGNTKGALYLLELR